MSESKTSDRIEITRLRIATGEIAREVLTNDDGAVVTFDGVVRNHSHGRATLYLEYEAYEAMALMQMRGIAVQLHADYSVTAIVMIHRLGRLEIGETSVFIAVSAAHRAAAFDACRFAIDTLKKTVPIWKKEYFSDGAVWADGELPSAPPKSAANGTAAPAETPAAKPASN